MRVRVEHDDGEREDVRGVRVGERAVVARAVPRGERFHEPVDLLRLPGEAKRLEEHAQRDVEIEFRKIKRPRERAHDGDGFVVVPAEEFADRRLVEPFRSKEEVRDIDRVGVLVR